MSDFSGSSSQKKKILFAVGIFPPEIGGPAKYSEILARQFCGLNYLVSVVTYGTKFQKIDRYEIFGVSRKWPRGLRQCLYFFKLFWHARNCDVILAFDSLGAGLPAVLVATLFNKKAIIRLGGDFIWEKFTQSNSSPLTLKEFYLKNKHRSFYFLRFFVNLVFHYCSLVIFTTNFQREIFLNNYKLDSAKTAIVGNVIEHKRSLVTASSQIQKNILWAGRFMKLKNLPFLIKVFRRVVKLHPDFTLELIGEGPEKNSIKDLIISWQLTDNVLLLDAMSGNDLVKKIERSYMCVLPSLTDISPNFIFECLSRDKPVLLTRETGIVDIFPNLFYIDPRKENDFFSKMLVLIDDQEVYSKYLSSIRDIRYEKTWPDLAKEYINFF